MYVSLYSDGSWDYRNIGARVDQGNTATIDDHGEAVTINEESASKEVRMDVVEPNAANLLSTAGNVLTVAETMRDSPIGEFARAGRPASQTLASGTQAVGRAIGGIGIGVTAYQWGTGKISNTEAAMDTAFGAIGFVPGGALISLSYFAGKAIYEYSTGKTMYDKPIQEQK